LEINNTIKAKTIFELLKCIFEHKTKWEELSDLDKKAFSPYMINRFISMDINYIDTINYLQQYTLTTMSPREVYKLYIDLFPKSKFWSKYVKPSNNNKLKISDKLVEFIAQNEKWSTSETRDNMLILLDNESGYDVIRSYLEKYGISNADAIKIYGLPKK
jgi:hypothetical protein